MDMDVNKAMNYLLNHPPPPEAPVEVDQNKVVAMFEL
jgi:hypothetical protein